MSKSATCCRYRYLSGMNDPHAWDQWIWSEPFRPANDDLPATPTQDASFVSENVNLGIAPPTEDPAYHARPDSSLRPQKLGFIPPRDWDREKDYGDEDPPRYITYRLGWKVKVHRRKWVEGTIQNVVLAPGWVWRKDLKHRIADAEKSNKFGEKGIFRNDTEIVLSVDGRKEKDVVLPFSGKKSVKWSEAEKQLSKWSEQYPVKRLSMYLTLNYAQENDESDMLGTKLSLRCSRLSRCIPRLLFLFCDQFTPPLSVAARADFGSYILG